MDKLPLTSEVSKEIVTIIGNNRTVVYINETDLNLQVNRLSGPMPSNFHHAPFINVVTGNNNAIYNL